MKVIGAILICLCGVFSAPAEVVNRQSFPVQLDISTSTCSFLSADISGAGEGQVVVRATADGNGGQHLSVTVTAHGTATDTNGGSYVFNHVDTFTQTTSGHQAQVLTATEVFNLIGRGGAPNVKLQATFHITVLPDGSMAVLIDHVSGAEGCFPG